MGYALFAHRKILLTDRVNNLNLQLTEVTNKKNKLTQLATAVADGEVSSLDLAQCQEMGLGLAYAFDIEGNLMLSKTSKEYIIGKNAAEAEAHKLFGGSKLGNAVGGGVLGAALGAGAGAGAIALAAKGAGALALAAKGAKIGTFTGGPLGALIGGGVGLLAGGIIANKVSEKTQAKNQYVEEFQSAYEEAQLANMVERLQKNISEMENMLDKQTATLETKLTATQSELESVKEAEAQAIKNSTPKYSGLA